MASPRALLVRAPGTNCDQESAFAFEQAGATSRVVHVAQLLEHPPLLSDYQILCFPGGFSYGDDISAGRILGNQVRLRLADVCQAFKASDKLVLGICNGFQILMKTGLLDVDDEQGAMATLAWNDSGRYEARWVHLRTTPNNSVFLQGIEQLELPVAHAEGKFVCRDQSVFDRLAEQQRLVLRYCAPSGDTNRVAYPDNPNGAMGNIAGICDTTGRVLGLMPHPERYLLRENYPNWTRDDAPSRPHGRQIFANAVAYFS